MRGTGAGVGFGVGGFVGTGVGGFEGLGEGGGVGVGVNTMIQMISFQKTKMHPHSLPQRHHT